MTLRTRLALGAAAAMTVVVVVVASLVYVAVRTQLRDQLDQQLADRADAVARVAAASGDGRTALPAAIPAPPPDLASGYIQLVSPDGSIAGSVPGAVAIPVDETARGIAAGRRERAIVDATVEGQEVRLLTTRLNDVGAFQVALPLTGVNDVLGRLRWTLGLIGSAGILLAALLAAVVARAGLAPLRRLDRTAEEVAHTVDLGRRIEVESTDEVGRLARTFNEMLAALERSQDAQRQLIMDASHELRTPLTALRTNIEVLADEETVDPEARRRLLEDVTAQLEDLSHLVADVVSLARGNEPQEALEDLRLDRLARACVDRAALHAPALRFSVSAEPTLVLGAPGQIGRAIGNLLDNAAKWSPPGAEVEVRVADGELTVRDHGPGIDPSDLPHVFDRFYRAPAARRLPGSGLGLAIVRQAAEAHGGVVVAEAAEGGGALLRLRLPLAAAADPHRTLRPS